MIKFIRGSKAKEIPEFSRSLPSYGSGKEKPELFWKDLFDALLRQGYLGEGQNYNAAGWTYSTVRVELKGSKWLKSGGKLMLEETANMNTPNDPNLAPSTSGYANLESKLNQSNQHQIQIPREPKFDRDWIQRFMIGPWKEDGQNKTADVDESVRSKEREIYKKLKEIRSKKAVDTGMTATGIADDTMLQLLTRKRPTTIEGMAKIEGFNIQKAGTLEDMLTYIRNFSIENQLKTDLQDEAKEEIKQKTPNNFSVCKIILYFAIKVVTF